MINHLRIQKNGTFKYRRRVPQELQRALGRTEFVKVLGKSEQEALRNYPACHQHVEQLLKATDPQGTAANLAEIKAGIAAQFDEWQLDPFSSGHTESEQRSRDEEADRILSRYPQNPVTGNPDPSDGSFKDQAMVTAL